MMDVRAAIRVRRSTRRYSGRSVPQELLSRLLALAGGAEHLCRPPVRVAVVSGRERVAHVLARYAGVYGLVRGAPHLLVGVLPRDDDLSRLDLGYVLEGVVLEATRLGLATCWMTGSYHPDRAAGEVGMRPGEVVAAVVALGYPRQDPLAHVHDRAVRRLVAAHRRRPLERIVFAGRWGSAWSPEGAEPVLVEMLECARLAPSARNRQPWRFIVGPGWVALALVEPAPIDGGIAMAHLALAAADLGRAGRWEVCLHDPALARSLALPPSAIPVGRYIW